MNPDRFIAAMLGDTEGSGDTFRQVTYWIVIDQSLDAGTDREIARFKNKIDAVVYANRRNRNPDCITCKGIDSMMPNHEPSRNCESGKRPHCTCDMCF